MENQNDYWMSWIISDYTPFEFYNRTYFLSTPSREARFLAEKIFSENYRQALSEGLLSYDDKIILLGKYGFWTDKDEDILTKLLKDVEDIKVQIFQSYTRTGHKNTLKRTLKDTQDYIDNMLKRKICLDNYTAQAIAKLSRHHFLIGSSIFLKKNKPLYTKNNWWNTKEDEIVNYAYHVMNTYIIPEHTYRSIAKSPSWRNIWNASKNVFGKCSSDLSDHQKYLIMWSRMYDSVYKSSECPSDEIIEDDDAIDGWFIVQRRNRDKNLNQTSIESKLPDKVRNSEEIYVMCEPSDLNKVMDCNDDESRLRWQSRMKQIQREGVVLDIQLNDRKREIQRQIHEKERK